MSEQQFGGFLQTIAFHLPFAAERAMASLLPPDLKEEKMRLLQEFASELQCKAQSCSSSAHSQAQQPAPPTSTIMDINNY